MKKQKQIEVDSVTFYYQEIGFLTVNQRQNHKLLICSLKNE